MTNPTPASTSTPGFWGTVWSTLKWILMKVVAPGVAILVVVLAVVLVSMGVKNLQIGGILQTLLSGWLSKGSASDTSTAKAIDVANSVPSNRVDPTGKVIPQGTPDSQGDTQAVVVPIQGTGGLFSNPSVVTVVPPGGDNKPINIQLPNGVQANDVDKVVIVQPGQFVVTVKDTSGVSAQSIDTVLKKYGG